MSDIRLLCCDNLELLRYTQDESVDFIYCDILYGTGRNFKQYKDLPYTKSAIIDHYLFRVDEMYRVLKGTGVICLQMSAESLHILRNLLDDRFGFSNFICQVVWKRTDNNGSSKVKARAIPNSLDYLVFYSKSMFYTYNRLYLSYSQKRIDEFKHEDALGRYRWQTLKCYSESTYNKLLHSGMIKIPQTSKYPQYKQYLHESMGVLLSNLWDDIYYRKYNSIYPTEKPVELLERVISIFTKPEDLVADYYAGSFTTALACKNLNRRFIGCDVNQQAVDIGLKRLGL